MSGYAFKSTLYALPGSGGDFVDVKVQNLTAVAATTKDAKITGTLDLAGAVVSNVRTIADSDLVTKLYADKLLGEQPIVKTNELTVNKTLTMAPDAIISGVRDPIAIDNPVPKGFLDTQLDAVRNMPNPTLKRPCRVVAVSDLNGNYDSTAKTLIGKSNVSFPAVDGVTLVINERILVKGQNTPAQNGVYTLTTVGTGSTPWVLSLASDWAEAASNPQGLFVSVVEGTTYGPSFWIMTSQTMSTIGSSPAAFTQLAGSGLPLSANSFLSMSVTGTTEATSTTTGAFRVPDGGGSVAKNLYVGGGLYLSTEALTPANGSTSVNPSVSVNTTLIVSSNTAGNNISGTLAAGTSNGFMKKILAAKLATDTYCDITLTGVNLIDANGTSATGKVLRFFQGCAVTLHWVAAVNSWMMESAGVVII